MSDEGLIRVYPQVRAEKHIFDHSISIYLCYGYKLNPSQLATHYYGIVEMKEGEEGKEHPSSFQIQDQDAQLLMNDLWTIGIRPSDKIARPEYIKETEAHITDLQSEVGFHRRFAELLLKKVK